MNLGAAEEESPQEIHIPAEIDWQMLDKSKFFFLGAALFSGVSASLYPMVVLKTRQQVAHSQLSCIRTAFHLVRHEGFRALYRGFGTSLMGTIPARALYMGALEFTKSYVGTATVRVGFPEATAATIANAAAGLSAAMAAQLVWTPVDVVSQRLMVQSRFNNPNSSSTRYINGVDAFRKILNADGHRGLYRGFGISILTYAPSNAVWWASYYVAQRLVWGGIGCYYSKKLDEGNENGGSNVYRPDSKTVIAVQGASAAMAGSISALITMPLDTIKTRLQVLDGDENGRRGPTIGQTLRNLVREGGWTACFKIVFTSLCHTDVYFWEAKGQTPLFPRIFGHEAGGIVESVGEGVKDLQPGDHVLPVFTGECGDCRHCKSEESNMCDLLRINTDRGVMISDGKTRFSKNGQPIHHFVGTSTFSEYTVIHFGCLAKINPAAPLDKVCVLSCGISTGFGATVNVAKPKKGQSVAIFGLGAVGLAAAEGARISGASKIIGVDLNPARFEEAKKFGCNEFVNPKDHSKPVQEVIAEMTNGGVDRSVECTGSIQAMISAFECVHDGWGVAVLVGVPNKDDAFKTHPMNFLNERTLKGTFFGNYKPRSDIPGVVEKYMNKEMELDKFITHSVPFSEINKAFDYMLKGESIRCIIRMGE